MYVPRLYCNPFGIVFISIKMTLSIGGQFCSCAGFTQKNSVCSKRSMRGNIEWVMRTGDL